MNRKPYSLRWLFECPFLFTTIFFIWEAVCLQMYLLRPENKNYWLKVRLFPYDAYFSFALFSLACLFEFIKYSIKLYKRNKKSLYKISGMYSDGRHLAVLIFIFIVLAFELAIGYFVEYIWRLGLHAIILTCLFAYSIDLSRKKQLMVVKAIRRLKSRDKYSIDFLTINFYMTKNIMWSANLLVAYTFFPIFVVISSPEETTTTILSLMGFIYGVSLLMMGPLFIIANNRAKKLLRRLNLKQ